MKASNIISHIFCIPQLLIIDIAHIVYGIGQKPNVGGSLRHALVYLVILTYSLI